MPQPEETTADRPCLIELQHGRGANTMSCDCAAERCLLRPLAGRTRMRSRSRQPDGTSCASPTVPTAATGQRQVQTTAKRAMASSRAVETPKSAALAVRPRPAKRSRMAPAGSSAEPEGSGMSSSGATAAHEDSGSARHGAAGAAASGAQTGQQAQAAGITGREAGTSGAGPARATRSRAKPGKAAAAGLAAAAAGVGEGRALQEQPNGVQPRSGMAAAVGRGPAAEQAAGESAETRVADPVGNRGPSAQQAGLDGSKSVLQVVSLLCTAAVQPVAPWLPGDRSKPQFKAGSPHVPTSLISGRTQPCPAPSTAANPCSAAQSSHQMQPSAAGFSVRR